MYDIKLGQGCGIKATMLTPAGGVCDLRRARYIAASLVLPSGATMNCEDIAFNEVTNGVYVRLLGTRELTTTGQYGIDFDYKAALACADVGVDKIRINPGNIGDDDRAPRRAITN